MHELERWIPTDLKAPLRFGPASSTGADAFDYASGQPNLYLLMRFKQALIAKHGVEAAYGRYAGAVTGKRTRGIVERPLTSLHAYALDHALVFNVMTQAGEPYRMDPPRVIGGGNHRPLFGETRCNFLACLADAEVSGRSSITHAGGVPLADFQGDELERIDDEVEFDPAIFQRRGQMAHVFEYEEYDLLAVDEAFSLLGCKSDFFGDWMSEYVTRFVAASLSGALDGVPILIDAHMPPAHRRVLEMMLPHAAVFIEVPPFRRIRVKRLWIASSIAYAPFHPVLNERFKWDYVTSSSERFKPVAEAMARRADAILGPARGPDKVFLARRAYRHRRLANKTEIETMAAAHGFEIAYPEDLTFDEQVRLVRDARRVIAPEGSALFLTYFGQQAMQTCILSHPMTDGVVTYGSDGVVVISGPQVGALKGRIQDMDYEIDTEVFAAFLADWATTPDA